jgi:hypothetical protein
MLLLWGTGFESCPEHQLVFQDVPYKGRGKVWNEPRQTLLARFLVNLALSSTSTVNKTEADKMFLSSLRFTHENTSLSRATDPVTQSWWSNSRLKTKLDAKYDYTCDMHINSVVLTLQLSSHANKSKFNHYKISSLSPLCRTFADGLDLVCLHETCYGEGGEVQLGQDCE